MIDNSERIAKLITLYRREFNATPEIIVRSPGRVNLIGEHTDYNLGYVLPASIDKCFLMAIAPNNENRINICALDIEARLSFALDEQLQKEDGWSVYLKGILFQLKRQNYAVKGFNLAFTSDIPIGAGLSSSTALDCGFLQGVAALHNWKLSQWDIVNISNRSNNDFIGVQGGVLDQFAIVFGMAEKCMMLDCRNRDWNYLNIHLDNYEWLLIDSKVRHDHTVSEYNNRPAECAQLTELIKTKYEEVESLRDVSKAHLDGLRSSIPNHLYVRGKFILDENERVLQFAQALKYSNISHLGKLLYESHKGLKEEYQVSCAELDFLVDVAKDFDGIAGARMVGGGFGGCTINLVKVSERDDYIDDVTTKFLDQFNRTPEIISFQISDGLSFVKV